MWTGTPEDRQLVTQLSKKIVEQTAPEEADLFDEMVGEYFADPSPPDLSATHSDDPLGFGLGELLVAVTPAAAAVASAAVGFIVSTLTRAAQDGGAEQVRTRLKQVLGGTKEAASSKPALTPDQLEELRKVARETANRYGMEEAQAEAMTNAMLVALMLGPDAAGSAYRSIKILFLAANPKGTTPLRLDEEIRGIDEALAASQGRGRFQLEQQWAVRVSDLQGLLLRHRPDIVHFSGHGSSTSTIILEDASGYPNQVPPDALSELFRVLGNKTRCIVLNACYSEAQAVGLAEHVDCVVGMTGAEDDRVAISFAAAFYQALAYGENVQTAFDLGVNRARLQGLAGADTPCLRSKHPDLRELRFV